MNPLDLMIEVRLGVRPFERTTRTVTLSGVALH
jgi:hypothetical protein